MALNAAYPEWLSAPQIAALCIEIEPRYRRNQRLVTARSLGRLHSYGQVDRIGEPVGRGGHVMVRGRPRKIGGAGYRYRLRPEARGLA